MSPACAIPENLNSFTAIYLYQPTALIPKAGTVRLFVDPAMHSITTADAAQSRREVILSVLKFGPASMSLLVNETGLSEPATRNHVKRLINAGLVKALCDGNPILYALVGDEA